MIRGLTLREALPSSFRDPAGYVFREDGTVKRAVTPYGSTDFEHFYSSGLHHRLLRHQSILDFHREPAPSGSGLHAILTPEQIPFISYPYEWSFDQLRDAAMLTLQIQEEALACGLSLKDASAFNVQFLGARPVFIDHTSFEIDDAGPWVAYEQFCRHFLAPLLLMRYRDPAWNRYLRADLEGPALPLVSRLLPRRTWLQPDTLFNIHLHARSQSGAPSNKPARPQPGLKKNILHSLRHAIERLAAPTGPPTGQSVWVDYETSRAHYTDSALDSKLSCVRETLFRLRPHLTFDLGANSGIYSNQAALAGSYCIALDSDPACVNQHYRAQRAARGQSILPLVMSLENPSPDSGFDLQERSSLVQRGPADFALVLALIHHLRLTARAPFTRIAAFLSSLTNEALIEFVPLTDPMAQKLLAGRSTGFDDYTLTGFQQAFDRYFTLQHCVDLPGTQRSLWLLRRKGAAA